MAERIRITCDQKNSLLQFMQTKYDMLYGLHDNIAPATKRSEWEAITLALNRLGPPAKGVEGWKRCWCDIRKSTREKVKKIRQHREEYGDKGPRCQHVLNLEDEFIIGIVGEESINESLLNRSKYEKTLRTYSRKPLANIASNQQASGTNQVSPISTTIIEPKLHKCCYCLESFNLSASLLVHKLKCHPLSSISTFFDDLLNSETFHSSDDGNDYTITITASFQCSPKAIIKEEVMLEDDESLDTPEMDIKIEPCDSDDQIDLGESTLPLATENRSRSVVWMIDAGLRTKEIQSQDRIKCPVDRNEYLGNSKPLVCPICNVWYEKIKGLQQHYTQKHPRSDQVTSVLLITSSKGVSDICSCTVCDQEFCSAIECAAHLLEKHEDIVERVESGRTDEIFRCHLCAQTRTLFISFQKHLQQHSTQKRQSINELCVKCGKMTKDMKRHVLKHEKQCYRCDICNKTFWSKFITAEHMRIHSGIRPFVCDNDGCGQAFTFRSGLFQHRALHHDTEKRHMCSYCGKKFSVAARLRFHVTLHTGERRYECKECGRRFRASTTLHMHMRTHTGDRPYKCNVCLKGFMTSRKLRNHMSRQRGCEPPKDCVDTANS